MQHTSFVVFVWSSQWAAIISVNNIDRLFYVLEIVSILLGTD